VDVSKIDTSTLVLGQKIAFPVLIAPTAMQKMAHPQGELATIKATNSMGTVMVLSSWSTTSLEEVAEAAPMEGMRWFQLYAYKNRNITENLIKRAEKAGYTALVLTVDTPILGRREIDIKNKFTLPPNLNLANFMDIENKATMPAGLINYVSTEIDTTLNWNDISWLRSISKLPIILKGILTAEDAHLAIQHGVAAIIVSNHGARQLDEVQATIEALPEVVKAVEGKIEVYLDGGVRRGTDVLKALALGADAVLIGRPILWGLAVNGEKGVKGVLRMLKEEIHRAMMLAGIRSISEIHPSLVLDIRGKAKL